VTGIKNLLVCRHERATWVGSRMTCPDCGVIAFFCRGQQPKRRKPPPKAKKVKKKP